MAKGKGRAPRQTVDRSNETAAQKFVRLGEARVTKAVKALRGIKNLSGRTYERSKEQCDAIVTLLLTEVNAIKQVLVAHKPGTGDNAPKVQEGPVIKL